VHDLNVCKYDSPKTIADTRLLLLLTGCACRVFCFFTHTKRRCLYVATTQNFATDVPEGEKRTKPPKQHIHKRRLVSLDYILFTNIRDSLYRNKTKHPRGKLRLRNNSDSSDLDRCWIRFSAEVIIACCVILGGYIDHYRISCFPYIALHALAHSLID